MRKFAIPILVAVVLMACLSCAGETPWRKATVTTYELVGNGMSISKDTSIILNANKVMSDEQLAKAKELFNKAQKIYVTMGITLKAAGRAESIVARDELLDNYGTLLRDFKTVSLELYNLISGLKGK